MAHRTHTPSHRHHHRPEGPCHFSLMSLSVTRRLLFTLLPLALLWLAVSWAAGGWS